MVKYIKFVQKDVKKTEIYKEVDKTSDLLFNYLNKPNISKSIDELNSPGNSSKKIQDTFIDFAENKLNFTSEKKGLFNDYLTPAIRPDYYKPIQNDGIIIEVERGKTLMNNMDLLDFWKCHICHTANHLFLLVPTKLVQNQNSSIQCYDKVVKRLSPFFKKNNYTNVHSLTIYGY